MKDFPVSHTFDDEQQYISENIDILLDEAINEFNSGNRSSELRDRFRKLRPFNHETAQYYIREIESQNGNL